METSAIGIVQAGNLNVAANFATMRGDEVQKKFAAMLDASMPSEKVVEKPADIDKSSVLYEKALDLESYFVKIMLSSMRKTVSKTPLSGETSQAGEIYDDMYYEQISGIVTKNAGFGLADQIYLQLAGRGMSAG